MVSKFLNIGEAPGPRAYLRAFPSWKGGGTFDGWTDENGRFEIDGLAQGSRARFDVDDARFADYSSYENGMQLAKDPRTILKAIRLTPGAAFEGRVTREGQPAAGIRIGAQENFSRGSTTSNWGDAITDKNGRYRMTRLNPGAYNIALDLQEALQSLVTAPLMRIYKSELDRRFAI